MRASTAHSTDVADASMAQRSSQHYPRRCDSAAMLESPKVIEWHDSSSEDEGYTCVDINGDEMKLSKADPYNHCTLDSAASKGPLDAGAAPESRGEGDCNKENWHCLDASEIAVLESIRTEASEWILLESGDGNDSTPVSRNPSLVSTVASQWLSDVSSGPQSPFPQLPMYTAKIATWAHSGSRVQDTFPDLSTWEAQMDHSQHRGVTLLRMLSSCESQLLDLETSGKQHTSPLLDLERGAACSKLCSDLVALAADALECGFTRNVPGAMEIFEQTNAAVERVASLLEQGSGTRVSSTFEAAAAAAHSQLAQSPGCGCLAGLFAMIVMLQQ